MQAPKAIATLTLILFCLGLAHSQQTPENYPTFSNAVYQGNDDVYNDYPLEDGEFYNPILQGCYPHPSITRKVDD